METYGAEDYGLYTKEEDIQEYADKNNMDANDLLYDIGGNSYCEADGKCSVIMKDESEQFNVDKHFYILPLERYPTLFTQAYKNKEEAIQELKDNYSEYLPKDFDYKKYFVHYVGTVYA
jgi:hypothetical protein